MHKNPINTTLIFNHLESNFKLCAKIHFVCEKLCTSSIFPVSYPESLTAV